MRFKDVLIGVAAGFLVAATVFYFWHDAKWREWDARVQSVVAIAADSGRVARAEAARADSIVRAVAARAPEIRTRIRVVRETVLPDTLRDPLIDELVAESDSLRLAFDAQKRAYTVLLAQNESLLRVLADRPRPKPALSPSVNLALGPFVGACADQNGVRFCADVRAGLQVQVNIPLGAILGRT